MSGSNPLAFGAPVYGQTGLTATGNSQGTAFPIASQNSVFNTVAPGTGALLPGTYGAQLTIFNEGVNALLLYPAAGDQIFGQAVNAPISILAGGSLTIACFSNPLNDPPRVWYPRAVVTGPTGATGATGATGGTGATGATGPTGP